MKDKRALFLNGILSPARLTRIVDVGANPLGEPPYSTLLKHGLCEIWGFEPQDASYEKLALEKGQNENYLRYAIGSGKKGKLYVCKGDGFSSIFKPNKKFIELMGRWPNGMRVKEVVPIQTRRLDDIVDIPEFDLLKIDVQGSETIIFKNATEKLRHAIGVISEVAMIPLYEGQPLLDEQMRELSSQGFFFHKFLFLKSYMVSGDSMSRLRQRRHKNQAVDGDAVFLKSLFSIADYPVEALKHLAILADAVFESLDLAVLALEHLAKHSVIDQSEIEQYIDLLPAEVVLPADG